MGVEFTKNPHTILNCAIILGFYSSLLYAGISSTFIKKTCPFLKIGVFLFVQETDRLACGSTDPVEAAFKQK